MTYNQDEDTIILTQKTQIDTQNINNDQTTESEDFEFNFGPDGIPLEEFLSYLEKDDQEVF